MSNRDTSKLPLTAKLMYDALQRLASLADADTEGTSEFHSGMKWVQDELRQELVGLGMEYCDEGLSWTDDYEVLAKQSTSEAAFPCDNCGSTATVTYEAVDGGGGGIACNNCGTAYAPESKPPSQGFTPSEDDSLAFKVAAKMYPDGASPTQLARISTTLEHAAKLSPTVQAFDSQAVRGEQ